MGYCLVSSGSTIGADFLGRVTEYNLVSLLSKKEAFVQKTVIHD